MVYFIRILLLFETILLLALTGIGQEINPGDDIIYNPKEVATIKITMLQANKTFLLAEENRNSEVYLRASLRFTNSKLDTLLPNVGIRLRGNTSRNHPKKSFKIDFKEFGAPKFYGYKKFNLKAENNDPSHLRELITLETFRLGGVPAARSHHAKVFINGEYMGLYLNVEQIDDEFTQSRFGNDKGNLYKCQYGCSLEANGQIYDSEIFELETNKEANDRDILANFVYILNYTSDEEFKAEISKILNIETAIKYFAVEALTGHWDGYSYLKNNLYLYENPETGLIEVIPYDVDNSYGIDWIGYDWATRNLADWANHNEPRPLNTRLLAVYEFRALYFQEINDLLDNIFSAETLFPKFDFYEGLLTSSIAADTYYPKTFGFTLNDYFDSHDKKVADHAPYGLKPFVTTRAEYAMRQIPVTSHTPVDQGENFVSVYPNPSNGRFINVASAGRFFDSGIAVYNSSGQPVPFHTEIRSGFTPVIFDQPLTPGLYFLSSGKTLEKFVVK